MVQNEATLLREIRAEAAARGAAHRILTHRRRWRRWLTRGGVALLILAMVAAADQVTDIRPLVHPEAHAMWVELVVLAVSCTIGGFAGGALALVAIFALVGWRIYENPVDDIAWAMWGLRLVSYASVL